MTDIDRTVTTQALRELATEQARTHGTADPLVRLLVDHAERGVMPAGVDVLDAVQRRVARGRAR